MTEKNLDETSTKDSDEKYYINVLLQTLYPEVSNNLSTDGMVNILS